MKDLFDELRREGPDTQELFGLSKEELAQWIQEDVSDPTGLRCYLEAKEEENDRRYEETRRMNRMILAVSIISAVIGLAGLLK